MRQVLAADIGGTNLRLARIAENGDILEETRAQADFSRSVFDSAADAEAHVLNSLASACTPLLEKADITALGIGFPGFFVGDSGVLAASPNLPQLHNFALAEKLGTRLGIRVAAQNDALCAALGEARFGVGTGRNHLMHITLGTGVGGGLILHDKPYTGENGMAMEFGHLRVDYDADARTCGCGGNGCVEAYASATAVADRYAMLTGTGSDSAAVFAAACQDDPTAIRVFKDAGMYLGRAIAEAVKLLDIETISISGGLTGAWELFQPSLMQELNHRLIPPLKGKINVLRSSLDDRGGLLGAAALVQAFVQA